LHDALVGEFPGVIPGEVCADHIGDVVVVAPGGLETSFDYRSRAKTNPGLVVTRRPIAIV
jgi:hypothetical protein